MSGGIGFDENGSLFLDSSLESKMERGYREALSWGVSAPSDGMIEFRFKVADDEHVSLWMSCERARNFCGAMLNMLQLHETMGVRNTYAKRHDSLEVPKISKFGEFGVSKPST